MELCPFPDLDAFPDSEVPDDFFKGKMFTVMLPDKRGQEKQEVM